MIRVSLFALVLVAVSFVRAEPPAAPSDPKPESKVQKYCPVMTQDEIDPKESEVVVYKGVKIYVCCETCVSRFKRDPAAYLDPKIVPALAGMKLPDRGIEQQYCPVFRDKKVSQKDPFTMYKGVKVYFYNTTAKGRFERDPEKYVDAKILPQLPKK